LIPLRHWNSKEIWFDHSHFRNFIRTGYSEYCIQESFLNLIKISKLKAINQIHHIFSQQASYAQWSFGVEEDFFENYWFCMPRSNFADMKPMDGYKLWKTNENFDYKSYDLMFDTYATFKKCVNIVEQKTKRSLEILISFTFPIYNLY